MTISFPLESNGPSPQWTSQQTVQRRSPLKQRTMRMMMKTMLGATLGAIFLGSTAIASRAADPQHLQQLLQTNSCENCDLRGAGLVYGNLQGANLQGANLQGANLSRSNLRYANLQGANLE
ncbi:MAG: pentapeptide repeat-containing protein, partial [Cyanobacteria bacterium P01_H01_bin.130]